MTACADELDRTIAELVANINEDPDLDNAEFTPAVDRLIDIGRPALPSCCELLLTGDEITRIRARRVIQDITLEMHGFRPGRGWRVGADFEKWDEFWKAMGDLHDKQTLEERIRFVNNIKLWLADVK